MGMFDYIKCDLTLDSRTPEFMKAPGYEFQTKSLENMLYLYTIDASGDLMLKRSRKSKSVHVKHTGVVEFYSNNIVGSGTAIYTRNGELAESASFECKFVDGNLKGDIKLTEVTREFAWHIDRMHVKYSNPVIESLLRGYSTDSLRIDKEVYVLWGGQAAGYLGKIIAKNDRQIVLYLLTDAEFHKKGDYEVLDYRGALGSTLFFSERDALQTRTLEQNDWHSERKRFEADAEQWRKNGRL